MKIKRLMKAIYNRVFKRKEIEGVIDEFEYKHGTMEMRMKHPQMYQIAQIWGEYFIEQGGVNYVEFTMFDPSTIGLFTVTIQKKGKPDSAAVNTKLRGALEQIHQHPDGDSHSIADRALRDLGYIKQEATS